MMMMKMVVMVVVIVGQTVRLLPIIGEADKEATYPSHGELHFNMIMMMLLLLMMMMIVVEVLTDIQLKEGLNSCNF